MARFSRPVFEASLVYDPVRVEIVLRGELDLATVPVLERSLDDAEASRPALLMLDLSELTFIDGAGLSTLLEAARRAARARRRLCVSHASDPIRRLLELSAVDQSIEVLPA